VAAELFLDGPVIAVTNEDAVVIPVEAPGHGIAAQQAKEEAEIAAGVLAGKNSASSTLLVTSSWKPSRESCGPRPWSQSWGAAIEQQPLAFTSAAQAALAMSPRAPLAGRSESGGTQQPAPSLPAERDALDLAQLLAQVMVVEPGVGGARQMQDAAAGGSGRRRGLGRLAAVFRSRSKSKKAFAGWVCRPCVQPFSYKCLSTEFHPQLSGARFG
jgi:hypothetical protein